MMPMTALVASSLDLMSTFPLCTWLGPQPPSRRWIQRALL
jgi:hypothetical protein